MSVNQMQIEDARLLMNSIHNQVTGKTALVPTSTADFISQANTALAVGTEPCFGALIQAIARSIVAVRPYNAKFKGIEADNVRWGGIERKISFADKPLPADEAYHGNVFVDGQSVDMWKISKPIVLETRYYGSDAVMDQYTVYEYQLRQSFENEQSFGSFVAGLTQHYQNVWEQYREDMARTLVASLIAAKNAAQQDVVSLLTNFNTATGQALTRQQAECDPDFWRWVRAEVNTISRRMTARSSLYQLPITGYDINRHTPVQDQKIYLAADILDKINTVVNATTYHDEPLKYADVEAVDFWQSIQSPLDIEIAPTYIDTTGAVVTASNQSMTDVFGVIFDKDAVGYSVIDFDIRNTRVNEAGLYFNVFMHSNVRYMMDLTEKAVVLTI